MAEADEIQRLSAEVQRQQHLFDNCFVFLSREVPRYAIEFVVTACGGKVSWASVAGVGGGPFDEKDARVTHHIVDRPNHKPTDLKRHYVQPQWIFDCINATQLLGTAVYAPGASLPAHLSPFVQEGADDYVPPERTALAQRVADADEEEAAVASPDEESDIDEEETYHQEMAKELKGETFVLL